MHTYVMLIKDCLAKSRMKCIYMFKPPEMSPRGDKRTSPRHEMLRKEIEAVEK